MLDIESHDVLFVGDSVNDILPANAIEMPCCFLGCGESRVTGDNQIPAEIVISSLADLYGVLQKNT